MAISPFPKRGQDPEPEQTPIFLYDEAEEEMAFDFLDTVERGGKTYIVLLPRTGDGDSVTIMEMVEDPAEEDSYTFYPVENDKVLQSVFKTFRKKNGLE